MKRYVYFFVLIMVCFIALLYWGNGRAGAKLVASQTASKQVDDFIVHIHVEKADAGIQVFRSIQYVGEEAIEISHQTPLVSVSFQTKNHDFTGSPVSKTLEPAASYYPQDKHFFSAPQKGNHVLYVMAKFSVNGENIIIEHQENLEFD